MLVLPTPGGPTRHMILPCVVSVETRPSSGRGGGGV
jgi:hypothetical protein